MSSNCTPNYQLNQWEPGDKVQRADFNADNAKIDAALKAEADARSSAVAEITAQLAGKAAQSAVTALSGQVAKCGNCQIWTTTYTGTGQYGADHPNSITFPKVPAIAFVISTESCSAMFAPGQTGGATLAVGGSVLKVSWTGRTLSWSQHQHANGQMNNLGETYRVIALMTA